MAIALLVILVVMAVAALPHWPYSRGWNYAPTGVVALVAVVVGILMLKQVI